MKNRISIDELISEVRQAGLCTLEDVDYAIMEQNGRITVLPRKNAQPPTMRDLGMKGEESGILHVLIENGVINRYNLNLLGLDDRWLQAQLKRKKWRLQDVFLLGCDDTQRLYWIKREKKE